MLYLYNLLHLRWIFDSKIFLLFAPTCIAAIFIAYVCGVWAFLFDTDSTRNKMLDADLKRYVCNKFPHLSVFSVDITFVVV